MLPTFIGIGAQKSGTSWIFSCLEEHPEIFIPLKEIHFFSKDELFNKGLQWYLNHFIANKKRIQIGEFSTTYLHSRDALDRIQKSFPNTKIIVSLREPTSRAVSHFKNDIMAGIIPKDSKFSDFILNEDEYWKRGLYFKKIKWLFKKFGKNNVKVLIIEEAKINPQNFISSLYKFLNVDSTYIPPSINRKINVSSIPKFIIISQIMDLISKVIRKLGMSFIIRYLRKKGIIEFARKTNSFKNKPVEYKIDWPQAILREFQKDKEKLQILLGRKLIFWEDHNT